MTKTAKTSRRPNVHRLVLLAGSTLALVILGRLAVGSAATRGTSSAVVIGLHSSESSRGLAASRGLPQGQAEGGRYAVVRLIGANDRRDAYALVYVPPNLEVRRHDHVEIDAGESNLAAEPGKGVVVGVTAAPARGHQP